MRAMAALVVAAAVAVALVVALCGGGGERAAVAAAATTTAATAAATTSTAATTAAGTTAGGGGGGTSTAASGGGGGTTAAAGTTAAGGAGTGTGAGAGATTTAAAGGTSGFGMRDIVYKTARLSALDRDAGSEWQDDYVLAAPVTARGSLLVVLPGWSRPTADYERLLGVAGALGYHVVVLAYANTHDHRAYCYQQSMLAGCERKFIEEVVKGAQVSSLVTLKPTDHVYSRLRRVIAAAVAAPDAYGSGWAAFQRTPAAAGNASTPSSGGGGGGSGGGDDDAAHIDFSRVTLAGVSLGASYAAYIGKTQAVARVLLFGGPDDVDFDAFASDPSAVGAASWLADPLLGAQATPGSRWLGMLHPEQTYCTATLANWANIGVGGAAVRAAVRVPGDGSSAAPLFARRNARRICGVPAKARGPNAAEAFVSDDDAGPQGSSARWQHVWEYMLDGVDTTLPYDASVAATGDDPAGDCACAPPPSLGGTQLIVVIACAILGLVVCIGCCGYGAWKIKKAD